MYSECLLRACHCKAFSRLEAMRPSARLGAQLTRGPGLAASRVQRQSTEAPGPTGPRAACPSSPQSPRQPEGPGGRDGPGLPPPRAAAPRRLSPLPREAPSADRTPAGGGGGSGQDPAPGPVCPRPPRFDLGSHATFKTQTHGQSSFSPLVYFPHHSKNPDVTAKARQRTRSDFTPPWSWGLADHGGLATARVSGQN